MKYNCIKNSDSPEVMRARMKHGIAAYGIYVTLMQLLEEDEDHKLSKDYSMIAYEMRVDVSVVQSVVEDFDLFEVEDEYFYSKELSGTIEQARKVSEARARAGRAGGAAKARNFAENAKESSSKCQANARKNVANASESLANARKNVANARNPKENETEKENLPPKTPIKEKDKEKENCLSRRLSSNELFLTPERTSACKKPQKEPTPCHRGRQIFEAYFLELYGEPYYWQAKDAKAMNSILKKIAFARSHRTVPLPTDSESLLKAWGEFLHLIDKTWIMNNFSVNKIDSQYNEIVSEMKNHKQNVTSNGNKYRKESGVPKYESKAAYESGFGSANG
nr:MAG TPA: protein of unknown function (DUF4373) [Caudoviricetes sp.]